MIVRQFGRVFLLCASLAMSSHAQGLSSPYIPAMRGQTSALSESVPGGAAASGSLRLGLKEAVDRAIRNNLAAVYSDEAERIAAARRLGDLAELFPRVDVRFSAEQRQINLAANGFGGFPGIRDIIGPFGLVDMRAVFTQPIVDRERRHDLRESIGAQRAAEFTSANTRELVVLTAVDLYFQTVSSESRVTAVDAQLTRARALHARALDLKSAGLVPGIDVVRAEVEVRSAEQRLIQAKNVVRKQKLALARAIGLALGQDYILTDRLPAEEPNAVRAAAPIDLSIPALLERAYALRADVKALDRRIEAAEEAVKAARAHGQATINARGDYGVIGRNPASSHGTYSLGLEIRVPLFDRKVESEVMEKEALLRERKAERDSLRSRIEFETRSALLDLQSTSEQLRVAGSSQALARQQLDQAQDRFSAGVTDNLEVIQAQEAVALADEGVIQSLYGYNIARALLAGATGAAEKSIQDFLGRSPAK